MLAICTLLVRYLFGLTPNIYWTCTGHILDNYRTCVLGKWELLPCRVLVIYEMLTRYIGVVYWNGIILYFAEFGCQFSDLRLESVDWLIL